MSPLLGGENVVQTFFYTFSTGTLVGVHFSQGHLPYPTRIAEGLSPCGRRVTHVGWLLLSRGVGDVLNHPVDRACDFWRNPRIHRDGGCSGGMGMSG